MVLKFFALSLLAVLINLEGEGVVAKFIADFAQLGFVNDLANANQTKKRRR